MAQSSSRVKNVHLLAVASDQEALPLEDQVQPDGSDDPAPGIPSPKRRSRLGTWWHKHVVFSVPPQACLDHFANERTVLGYIRTSQSFSMLGIIVAQLMRLNTNGNPNPNFGYFKLSVPLSSTCQVVAIVVVLVGAVRFFRWQKAMALGKAMSSGSELLLTFGLTFMVLISTFVLCLTATIERSS